ncbi:hypothetical protein [Eremococcus coleocola]|uniref:hypothetical protein n=1 Tax=Eremococcus coleocola TaxID=88132 RepID=UPI0003F7921F|nr:hypothetical protein [Eremococcus coleocola]
MKKIFALLAMVLVMVSGLSVFAEEKKAMTIDDYVGSYEVKDSVVKYLDVRADQVVLYVDDLEGEIKDEDPYKHFAEMVVTHFAEADPEAEPVEGEPVITYTDNTNKDVEAAKVVIFTKFDNLITYDNKLKLKLDSSAMLSLEKSDDGLHDKLYSVDYKKIDDLAEYKMDDQAAASDESAAESEASSEESEE